VKEAADLLHRYPELALFVTIFLGQIIGRFHVKNFGLGSVVGALVAGIVVGIFARPELPQLLRWAFFYLFLFSIGYSVGPQFFGSLRKEAIPQLALAVILGITGLVTVLGVSLALGFDEGTAVGLLSGGLTQSAALGTGLNAIASLPIPEDLKARLSGAAPLADAITYGFGDLGLIMFITVLGPLLMRADLKAEAKALEVQLSGGRPATDSLLMGASLGLRGYRVENPLIARMSVEELERKYAEGRLSVQRLRRGQAEVDITPDSRIQLGDQLVVAARRATLVHAEDEIGPEIDDPETLAAPLKSVNAVVTNREAAGRTIAELAADQQMSHGVYLESLRRGEEPLPREMGTVIERGDVMRLVGAPRDVDRAATWLGFVERDLTKTDLTFVAAGISCGILLGLLTINFQGVRLGLGFAGSILVVGLLAGWARSRYPVFGSIPEAAQRVLADIGLIVFIAIIGLQAGPHAVEAYHERGAAYFFSIFGGGMIVTMVPPIMAMLVAHFVLKMNPLMTLAGIAGAQTCTPALNALREASGSNVGALGYTVPYAIGNILLTIWGPIVVAVIHVLRA
jgi:putative transport protein